MLTLLLEVARELGCGGRLAGALEADKHDDGGRMRRHRQPVTGPAQQLHQLVADDLDDLLAGGQRLEHVLADGLLADTLDEASRDLEVDVSLEEGDAYLSEGLDDILLRQPAETTEPVEDTGEASREAVQHGFRPEAGFWKRSRILAR